MMPNIIFGSNVIIANSKIKRIPRETQRDNKCVSSSTKKFYEIKLFTRIKIYNNEKESTFSHGRFRLFRNSNQ